MSHRVSRAESVFQGIQYCRGVSMVPEDYTAGSASQRLGQTCPCELLVLFVCIHYIFLCYEKISVKKEANRANILSWLMV